MEDSMLKNKLFLKFKAICDKGDESALMLLAINKFTVLSLSNEQIKSLLETNNVDDFFSGLFYFTKEDPRRTLNTIFQLSESNLLRMFDVLTDSIMRTQVKLNDLSSQRNKALNYLFQLSDCAGRENCLLWPEKLIELANEVTKMAFNNIIGKKLDGKKPDGSTTLFKKQIQEKYHMDTGVAAVFAAALVAVDPRVLSHPQALEIIKAFTDVAFDNICAKFYLSIPQIVMHPTILFHPQVLEIIKVLTAAKNEDCLQCGAVIAMDPKASVRPDVLELMKMVVKKSDWVTADYAGRVAISSIALANPQLLEIVEEITSNDSNLEVTRKVIKMAGIDEISKEFYLSKINEQLGIDLEVETGITSDKKTESNFVRKRAKY